MIADLLTHFGTDASRRLGSGGEAKVYAVDNARVLRLMDHGADPHSFALRNQLIDRLDASSHGFNVPELLDTGQIDGQLYSIEARIPGQSMDKELKGLTGHLRENLILSYLETSLKIRELSSAPMWFGDAARPDDIRSDALADYMRQRAAASLNAAGLSVDVDTIVAAVKTNSAPGLVHLDYFPGNVMSQDGQVTGVIDFGYSTVWADPDFTPVLAAVYLERRILDSVQPGDMPFARSWLAQNQISHLFAPLRRWIAAYWSFCADDDPETFSFVCSVLGIDQSN